MLESKALMAELLVWIAGPLEFDFFQRALLAVVLVSVLCAFVGSWVVLRGLSYIGDAMSHAVLPGIVAAFLMRGHLMLGALLAALLTALGIGYVSERSRLKQDSAIGIVFVGMFSLGVVLLSRAPSFTGDLAQFLIGSPLSVSGQDLWIALALTMGVGSLLLVLQKELLLTSFDPIEAHAIGLPVKRLNQFLLVIIGFVVVLTVQLAGTTLSVSLLITSSATARLLSTSLKTMMIRAALLGVLGGVLGLYLSYYWNTAAGATIVLVNTFIFLATLLFKGQKT